MGNYKSETERAAELQEKAISIRDYMQEPDTMTQITAALPKWLRADRFVRLFYTAMMQNPSLMECTKQSLLSCMIQAAQIGLEPVFGKAALIPYKKEVTFQPMYKGLMEVARRFADITITGHVVYEVDEFDIEWGDNERLHHKPIFSKERLKSPKIGAYDIWKVGNEIRSRRFMPTADILYIRDTYSKTWQQYGKTSVWGKHPDDMYLKTVIKGHCKMEPQCIEMERVVELDDRAEIEKSQLGMGRIGQLPMPTTFDFMNMAGEAEGEPPAEGKPPGEPPAEGKPPAKAPGDVAKLMAAQCDIPEKDIKEFISFIAKKQEKTTQWVEDNALKSPESFIRAVRTRLVSLEAEARKEKPKVETGSVDAGHMKEFWNLRKGAGGKTGLKAYVAQHLDRIYNVYSEPVRVKLIEKFQSFYPGEVFPAPIQKPKTHETEGTGETGGPRDTGASGAEDPPPFENPNERAAREKAEAEATGQSTAEGVGESIREGKVEEEKLIARYENSVESVMKFDKSGVEYTLDDFEKFMMEMAHMEGIAFSSFQADVMRRHQFPDYFDKFIARLSGGEA